MLSKTLTQWFAETERVSSLYQERYAQAFDDPSCSAEIRNAYCKVSKNNWALRDVLGHIIRYGAIHTPEKCAACAHNEINHNQKLRRTYDIYARWIKQLDKD